MSFFGKPASGMSDGVKVYALLVLTLVYAFNFIDRYILVVMQELIKADLGLSDTQLGVLSGFTFALFYVTAGLPVARLADRSNRRNIVAGALTIWSAMTALSGLVQSYGQLVAARIGVGIGEAGCSPPAHSMISGMFSEKRRATALAIYSSGLFFGVLLGYLVGGQLAEIFGWRTTFLMVGLPGIALAMLLMTTVPEPARHADDSLPTGTGADQPKASLADTLGLTAMVVMLKDRTFRTVALASAIAAFFGYGIGNFMPSFLARYHGLDAGDVGLTLALAGGFGGMVGSFGGGYLADRIAARGDMRWYLWTPGLASVIGLGFYVLTFLSGRLDVVILSIFLGQIFSTMYLAPAIATSHRLVSARQRAMASAVLYFVINLIGLGLGPVTVGALSDLLRALSGVEQLREALLITLAFGVIKAWLFWRAGTLLPGAIARRDAEKQAAAGKGGP
ncbi:spinster family MFS transporter [Yunchengibacter salinarum]|uniref:spinster family MFS transporter n=1 Tax=Yunchengibacter salinarum TaxID=3133399 RepID=UPI0035B6061F